MDLKDARVRIDSIDDEITRLFAERMGIARDIAAYSISCPYSIGKERGPCSTGWRTRWALSLNPMQMCFIPLSLT